MLSTAGAKVTCLHLTVRLPDHLQLSVLKLRRPQRWTIFPFTVSWLPPLGWDWSSSCIRRRWELFVGVKCAFGDTDSALGQLGTHEVLRRRRKDILSPHLHCSRRVGKMCRWLKGKNREIYNGRGWETVRQKGAGGTGYLAQVPQSCTEAEQPLLSISMSPCCIPRIRATLPIEIQSPGRLNQTQCICTESPGLKDQEG